MRDYQTKTNAGGLSDSITAEKLGAGEANSFLTECKTAVSSSGQTLASANGTAESTDQLAKALAIYSAGGGEHHIDTGVANAYVLNPVSPLKSPVSYFNGFTVSFKPGNINTGASTVNIASLGVKNITDINGAALSAGVISGSVLIKYNLTDDRFEVIFSSFLLASGGVPIGSYIFFPGDTPPSGFLECDGSAISRTTYSDLFSVISTEYGVGDGATTFNIPDLRGYFLRGWDHGAGVDPDAATRTDRGDGTTGDNNGTLQGYDMEQHDHDVDYNNGGFAAGGGAASYLDISGLTRTTTTYPTSGGNETRPININVMFCIKYEQ